MNSVKRFMMIVAGLLGALCIVGLQLAWNVQSPSHLHSITERAGTARALANVLPDYAAGKLPDSEAANKAFRSQVKAADIDMTLASLNESIAAAYVGRTDTVEVDLSPITRPVIRSGYQIPPGTVFAENTVQIGGLAAVLRTANRATMPMLLCFVGVVALTTLLGIKRGFIRSICGVLLFAALFLSGFFLATLALPFLVNTLVTSSGLDASLRSIVVDYISVVARDAGRYYLIWAVVLLVIAGILSGLTGMHRRPKKKHHKIQKDQKSAESEKPNEAW